VQPEAARAALASAAGELGLDLQAAQVDALVRHWGLLQKWNRVYNLTAVRDPAQMLQQHLVDSLAAVMPLTRWLAGATTDRGAVRVLDVGSGAGLPGLVLAAALPGIDVTCVDAVDKKVSFVRQVIAEVGVPNLHATHARVETLQAAPFDVITSRAFASLEDFASLTRHLLADEGVWMALKGKEPHGEMAALNAARVFHVEQLDVPGLDAERCIVWMRPPEPASPTI
jgi:16S rRNA (guanine527-N7)-methyltransferase